MKKHTSLFLIGIAITGLSCLKPKLQEATVVKDCTGMYLRVNGKDYHVCNTDKIQNLDNGARVSVRFKPVKTCTGPEKDAIVCMMYHENQGWIEIRKLEKL